MLVNNKSFIFTIIGKYLADYSRHPVTKPYIKDNHTFSRIILHEIPFKTQTNFPSQYGLITGEVGSQTPTSPVIKPI